MAHFAPIHSRSDRYHNYQSTYDEEDKNTHDDILGLKKSFMYQDEKFTKSINEQKQVTEKLLDKISSLEKLLNTNRNRVNTPRVLNKSSTVKPKLEPQLNNEKIADYEEGKTYPGIKSVLNNNGKVSYAPTSFFDDPSNISLVRMLIILVIIILLVVMITSFIGGIIAFVTKKNCKDCTIPIERSE